MHKYCFVSWAGCHFPLHLAVLSPPGLSLLARISARTNALAYALYLPAPASRFSRGTRHPTGVGGRVLALQLADADGSGGIDLNEFRQLFALLSVISGESVNDGNRIMA
jgi:hypothetical protein